MRHVVIGTAGHVDHGKTALVYALTEVHTDRLPEEQRRGITIELGFAPWQIDDDTLVSVIDAPGHRKLVHHMIAGASGIDMVMLIVAADEGVMPQTREHIAACRLLGVRRAVIAITKADRADEELAELAAEEARELLEEQGIKATAVVCSAKTGQGIDTMRAAVLEAIGEIEPPAQRTQRTRLSVDRVFSVKGAGTVVTGTLVEGRLRLSETLRIIGPDREVTAGARGLHVHGEAREQADAPTRLAINLGGVAVKDIHRGDVITNDSFVAPTRVVDVWLTPDQPMKRGSEASMFVGTARSIAKIQPLGAVEVLEQGGLVRLRLHTPLVVFGGDRFVLRGARVDGPTGAVVGGGVVLDAHPPKSLRAVKRQTLLEALQVEDADAMMALLAAEHEPHPVTERSLPSRFAMPMRVLSEAAARLVEAGSLLVVEGGWVSADGVKMLRRRALETVGDHHRAEPLDPGLRKQTLREQLTQLAGPEVGSFMVQRLLDAGVLLAKDEYVRLASFKGDQDPEAKRALADARGLLSSAALNGVTENAMLEQLKVSSKKVRAVMAALVRRQEAIQSGDLWFDAKAVAALQAKLEAHLDAHGKLTIAEFKEMTGLGRRQSIPLLEHFDRTKVTKRQGSERVRG